MNRRRVLSLLALGTVPTAGCMDSDSDAEPSTVERNDTTIETDTTENHATETTPEPCTKTVPRPEEPHFEDVSIKNRTDEPRTVEVTVYENSTELFRSEYEVQPGALVTETRKLFTERSTYEVRATAGGKSRTSEDITPTSDHWRLYNGVRVELESEDAELEIGFLYPHAEEGTTPSC